MSVLYRHWPARSTGKFDHDLILTGDCLTDVAEIDEQQQELFRRVNHLMQARKQPQQHDKD